MMQRLEAALEQVTPGGSGDYRDAIPARRYAEPHEIANVVAYLAVDAPLYLTGAAIPCSTALCKRDGCTEQAAELRLGAGDHGPAVPRGRFCGARTNVVASSPES